jgi:hypothetical protein
MRENGFDRSDMDKTTQQRLWTKVSKGGPDECWEWTAAQTGEGYGRFKLNGRLHSPHRLIYELEHGPIGDGMMICHTCDNPSCCNPSHLFKGTRADNMRDAYQKGRVRLGFDRSEQIGSAHPSARLTETQVKEIRALHADSLEQREIAKQYGVSDTTVSRIVRRITWTHI